MLATNKVRDIQGSDELNEKCGKLLKIEKLSKGLKLSKSGNSKGKKSAKSKKLSKSGNSLNFDAKKTVLRFVTSKARAAFNYLWLALTKAPILQYFDPKYYIQVKTDALGYAISGVLSQLAFRIRSDRIVTKTNLCQWHLVKFFTRKMILAKTRYKAYNDEFLAIVKAFIIWR